MNNNKSNNECLGMGIKIIEPPPFSCLGCAGLIYYRKSSESTNISQLIVECRFVSSSYTYYQDCCCSNCLIKTICSDACPNLLHQVGTSERSSIMFGAYYQKAIKREWNDNRKYYNLNVKIIRKNLERIHSEFEGRQSINEI